MSFSLEIARSQNTLITCSLDLNVFLGNLHALNSAADNPLIQGRRAGTRGEILKCIIENIELVPYRLNGGHLKLIPFIEIGGFGAGECDVTTEADIDIIKG